MRVLTVDIGNTAIKGSIFEDGRFLGSALAENRTVQELRPLIDEYSPQGAICCSVGNDAETFVADLETTTGLRVMTLTHDTALPIGVEYGTPATLGLDRVAAAVGAVMITHDALVVDAGTAMTLDIVADGAFRGGNISPGLRLRFRSLNNFTSRLPLVTPADDFPDFGADTETAIRAGVTMGILDEIENTYRRAKARYPKLRIILTGGDAPFLETFLEADGLRPVTVPSLVGRGLEEIYKYNYTDTGNPD